MSRNDPYPRSNFLVEIEGVVVAGFERVGGLETETAVIEYRNGNEPTTVRKIPGLTKYSNIVLRRGLTLSTDLWDWRKQIIDGNIERRSGSILVLNENREPAVRFNFHNGWPCRWRGPVLNAHKDRIAIEVLEIAVERIELDS